MKNLLLLGLGSVALVGLIVFFVINNNKSMETTQTRQEFTIAADTAMGAVTLNVRDLEKMTDFYGNKLGLEVISEDSEKVTLGKDGKAIIVLVKQANLSSPSNRTAGLYHSAILFDSEPALAKTLQNMFTNAPGTFEGSSDHMVSQAFYFQDPENNGLELYADRPRDQWQWRDGKIVMGGTYIDPQKFIQQYMNETTDKQGAKMGHVHLRVGDIAKAKEFYVGVLGFEVTAEMSNALFVSAGGYHHHLGMNTWESLGAGKRTETLGLRSFEIILPNQAELDRLKQRLIEKNIPFETGENSIAVADPWGNQVILLTK